MTRLSLGLTRRLGSGLASTRGSCRESVDLARPAGTRDGRPCIICSRVGLDRGVEVVPLPDQRRELHALDAEGEHRRVLRQPPRLLEVVGERHRLVGRLEVAGGRDVPEGLRESWRRPRSRRPCRRRWPGSRCTGRSGRRRSPVCRGRASASRRSRSRAGCAAGGTMSARVLQERQLAALEPLQRRAAPPAAGGVRLMPGRCITRTVRISACWLASPDRVSVVGGVGVRRRPGHHRRARTARRRRGSGRCRRRRPRGGGARPSARSPRTGRATSPPPAPAGRRRPGRSLHELLVVVDDRRVDAVGQAVEAVVVAEGGQRAARVVVAEVDAAVVEELVDRLDDLVLVQPDEVATRRRGRRRAPSRRLGGRPSSRPRPASLHPTVTWRFSGANSEAIWR